MPINAHKLLTRAPLQGTLTRGFTVPRLALVKSAFRQDQTRPALLALSAFAWAAPGQFSPQRRIGLTVGDQWEPSVAADASGHVFVLYPQYGPVPGCNDCKVPSMMFLVSNDNKAFGPDMNQLLRMQLAYDVAKGTPERTQNRRRTVRPGLNGTNKSGRPLVVAHADRGDVIRMISARPATRAHRKIYEEG